MTENLAVRDFLAENYSSYAEVKALWQSVGGNIGRILDQTDSRSRWSALLLQVENGAVSRLKLLSAVSKDYPGSPAILEAIRQELPLQALTPAKQLVEKFIRSEEIQPIDIDFTLLDTVKPEELAPAIAVQLSKVSPEEQKRFVLNYDTLKEKTFEAALGAGFTMLFGALTGGIGMAIKGVMP